MSQFLYVNTFTGNLLVIICMSRRLSSVLILEDFRYLLMACRHLGSRMKKSVVLVEVTGVMGTYDSVGRGCVSWWILRMYSRHLVLFFHV